MILVKKIAKKMLFIVSIMPCFISFSIFANDINTANKAVVVSFTRHTFRGYSMSMPTVIPPIYGLHFHNDAVAYQMNATPNGVKIARLYGERFYNKSAEIALKAIGSNPKLAGRWSSIRPDLAAQRTFVTAAALYEGLSKNNSSLVFAGVPITGAVTQKGKTATTDDVAAVSESQMMCFLEENKNNQNASVVADVQKKMTSLSEKLIHLLGGKPPKLSSQIKVSTIKTIASAVEFHSDLNSFSLQSVVKNNINASPEKTKTAVKTALSIIGYSFLEKMNGLTADVFSLPKLNYIDSLSPGTQKIIVTHDTILSALLQSLQLISVHSKPDDLAIYPLETVTIAMNNGQVAIVRTRINMSPNGSLTGDAGFEYKVIWTGTREAWNAKVTAIQSAINQHSKLASCLSNLPLPKAIPMKLNLGK